MIPVRDSTPRRSFPFVTLALIALNAYVFYIELGYRPAVLEALVADYGLVPVRLTRWLSGHGNPLDPFPVMSLFTSMFIHGGWAHILGNLLYLWIFGDNVEERLGRARYLLFYLLAGAIGGAAQVWATPTSGLPTVGASGAIAGVLGAYFITFPRAKVTTLVPIVFFPWFVDLPAILFLGLWFVLQLFSGVAELGVKTAQLGGVAFWAHAGGFAAGAVLMALMRPAGPARSPRMVS